MSSPETDSGRSLTRLDCYFVAEPGQPFDKIVCELVAVKLVEVVHPQVLKMTLALQQLVADDKQSMANGYDGPLPPAMGCDSLKVGRKDIWTGVI